MQLFQLIYQLQNTQSQETESILDFISTKSEEEKKKILLLFIKLRELSFLEADKQI
jgi:transcription termination factor NusB